MLHRVSNSTTYYISIIFKISMCQCHCILNGRVKKPLKSQDKTRQLAISVCTWLDISPTSGQVYNKYIHLLLGKFNTQVIQIGSKFKPWNSRNYVLPFGKYTYSRKKIIQKVKIVKGKTWHVWIVLCVAEDSLSTVKILSVGREVTIFNRRFLCWWIDNSVVEWWLHFGHFSIPKRKPRPHWNFKMSPSQTHTSLKLILYFQMYNNLFNCR